MPKRGLLPAPSPMAKVLLVPSVMSVEPRPGVDVEHAAGGRWHLAHLAQGGVGPLAQQVVAGRDVGQRPAGERDQERRVDDPARAVARAVEDLHLDGDEVGVGRIVPVPVRVPAADPVLLFEEGQQRDEAAEAARLQVVGAGDGEARGKRTVGVVVVVQGDAQLLEVVDAGGAVGRFAAPVAPRAGGERSARR